MEISNKFSHLLKSFLCVLVMASVGMLTACGSDGGSDSAPPPSIVTVAGVDGTGYYKGTAGVKQSDDITDLTIIDLQGLVDGKRFMVISVANVLLYEGTMTFNTETEFTANTAIYQDGVKIGQTTVNGTILEGSKITGTLSGTGVGNGAFTMDYAISNTVEADVARLVTNPAANEAWEGEFDGYYEFTSYFLQIDGAGTLIHFDSVALGIFDGCDISGSIEAIPNKALYRMSFIITGCVDTTLNNSSYTGLATLKSDINTDDTLVFVFSNNSVSGLDDLDFITF